MPNGNHINIKENYIRFRIENLKRKLSLVNLPNYFIIFDK